MLIVSDSIDVDLASSHLICEMMWCHMFESVCSSCMFSAQACIIAPSTTCCVASEIGLPRQPAATGADPRLNLVASNIHQATWHLPVSHWFSDYVGCGFWSFWAKDGSASHPASTSSPGGWNLRWGFGGLWRHDRRARPWIAPVRAVLQSAALKILKAALEPPLSPLFEAHRKTPSRENLRKKPRSQRASRPLTRSQPVCLDTLETFVIWLMLSRVCSQYVSVLQILSIVMVNARVPLLDNVSHRTSLFSSWPFVLLETQ